LTLFVNGQDKMGFGNDPEGADSAGFGTVTTWVKPNPFVFVDTLTTVTIGSQIWTKYNLHLTDDGTGIYSYNDEPDSSAIYGYLYTWEAAMRTDSLIPGYHLPSHDEVATTLVNSIGGVNYGGKLMESSSRYWSTSRSGATNSTGFTGLGAGYRTYLGEYQRIRIQLYFWSSTNTPLLYAEYLAYTSGYNKLVWGGTTPYPSDGANNALSVRLIKD